MGPAIYNFGELDAIVRFTTGCVALSPPVNAALLSKQLAEFFDSESAAISSYGRCGQPNIGIILGSWGTNLDYLSAIDGAVTDLWKNSQVTGESTSVALGKLLVSCQPAGADCSVMTVVGKGSFTAKAAKTLRVIHSSLRLKLTQIAPIPITDQAMSPRQQQVQQGLLEGLADKEIAARLGISPHTVHVHVKNLFRRRKVNSRAELLCQFLRRDGEKRSIERQRQIARGNQQFPGSDFQHPFEKITPTGPVVPIAQGITDVLLRSQQTAAQLLNAMPKFDNLPLGVGSHHGLQG